MTMQCNVVRFLFVGEMEATGAETLGALEHNVMVHISSKNPWRYKSDSKTVRPFGCVNVCLLGDFWQLAPTGQIAIMSDVTAPRVLENATGHYIMNVFWNSEHPDPLETRKAGEKVLELTTKICSGDDVWYSNVLES